jgi:hypothetical protein
MLAENFLISAEYSIDITKGFLSLVNSKGESMGFSRVRIGKKNSMAK